MSGLRRASCAGLCLAACLLSPRPVPAQGVPAVYGLVSGTVAGVYVTTGVFVTKARTGSFLYSLEDALRPRWELIPVAVMPIGGFVLGLADDQRLAHGIKWGAAGFAAGAVAGLGVGTLLRDAGGESQWAGAIIGSAAGLFVGSLYATLSYSDEETEPGGGSSAGTFPIVTFRVPL